MTTFQSDISRDRSGGLDGEVAIVTGAGHGIGAAYARGLARAGCRVAVTDIDRQAAESVALEIVERGDTALALGIDIADPGGVATGVDAVIEGLGSPTILINNAAIFATVPIARVGFEDIALEEWDSIMGVNVRGTWLMCRAVVPHMKALGRGRIINVSSTTALAGSATRAHYVASKAAVLGLTKSLARELGAAGITVNCIAPGSTLSEEAPDTQTRERRERAATNRSIPRLQTPEDLVGTVLFLASSGSGFITGQTIIIDGGTLMQ